MYSSSTILNTAMAVKLSGNNLQVLLLQLADYLCNSVGVLQQYAPPGQFGGFERTQSKPPAVQNEGQLCRVCSHYAY